MWDYKSVFNCRFLDLCFFPLLPRERISVRLGLASLPWSVEGPWASKPQQNSMVKKCRPLLPDRLVCLTGQCKSSGESRWAMKRTFRGQRTNSKNLNGWSRAQWSQNAVQLFINASYKFKNAFSDQTLYQILHWIPYQLRFMAPQSL